MTKPDWRAGRCFTIYHPTTSDWPGVFVVRPFDYMHTGPEPRPGPIVCVLASWKELAVQRAYFQTWGLTNFGPDEGDAPVIAETWL